MCSARGSGVGSTVCERCLFVERADLGSVAALSQHVGL